jgi:hypothetical protein
MEQFQELSPKLLLAYGYSVDNNIQCKLNRLAKSTDLTLPFLETNPPGPRSRFAKIWHHWDLGPGLFVAASW